MERLPRAETGLAARGSHGGWWSDRDVLGDGVNSAVVLREEGHRVDPWTRKGQRVGLFAGTIAGPVDPIGGVGPSSDVRGATKIPFLRTDGPVSCQIVAAGGIAAIRAGGIAHGRFILGPAHHGVGHLDFRLVHIPGEEGVAKEGFVVSGAHEGATRYIWGTGSANRAEVGVDQGQVVVAIPR